jgi:RND family efflux transporter MFP subunit
MRSSVHPRADGGASATLAPAGGRRRLVLGALLLIAAAASPAPFAGCKRPSSEPPPATDAAVPIAAEDMVRAARTKMTSGPRLSGSLDPRERADVRAEAGGSVVSVTAELGQPVKKGQVLARIEARAQSDAVRSAEAQVRAAREEAAVSSREVERTAALVEGGALARKTLESASSARLAAEARLGQAQAALASSRTQLGNATVRAPMDGVVSEAPVRQGDVVAPGAPLFTIIDPSSMRLDAKVSSEDLSAIAVGTPVRFTVRGYPGQEFDGTIERVAPAADPATRQIPLLVAIPNPSGKLVAGLFAEGRVASGQREALAVPIAAVDTAGDAPTVTRVKDGVVERVVVQLGLRDTATEQVEVSSGLAEGDVVLLRAARSLPPGTRVGAASAPDRAESSPGAPRVSDHAELPPATPSVSDRAELPPATVPAPSAKPAAAAPAAAPSGR